MAEEDTVYKPAMTGERYQLVNTENSGFWSISTLVPSISKIPTFHIHDDDVFVVAFPKSGITWLNEIIYLLMNNVNVDMAKSEKQQNRVPYLEYPFPGIEKVNEYPSPRVIKTHVDVNKLPKAITEKGTKLIYMIRNPKDVSVSLFHFYQFMNGISFQGQFDDFMEDFISGKVMYGPWLNHVIEYWQAKKRMNKSIHILFYEELIQNPIQEITKLAAFLEKDYNCNDIEKIVHHCSFENMKTNPSTNFTHLEESGLARKPGAEDHGRIGLMRKGIIGDWENYYSSEMSDRLDELVTEKLKSVGLEYCYKTQTWTKQ